MGVCLLPAPLHFSVYQLVSIEPLLTMSKFLQGSSPSHPSPTCRKK